MTGKLQVWTEYIDTLFNNDRDNKSLTTIEKY